MWARQGISRKIHRTAGDIFKINFNYFFFFKSKTKGENAETQWHTVETIERQRCRLSVCLSENPGKSHHIIPHYQSFWFALSFYFYFFFIIPSILRFCVSHTTASRCHLVPEYGHCKAFYKKVGGWLDSVTFNALDLFFYQLMAKLTLSDGTRCRVTRVTMACRAATWSSVPHSC